MVGNPDWANHAVSLFLVALATIGLLFTFIFAMARQGLQQLLLAIKNLDDTISQLFSKYDDHEHRLATLEGKHEARVNMNIKC